MWDTNVFLWIPKAIESSEYSFYYRQAKETIAFTTMIGGVLLAIGSYLTSLFLFAFGKIVVDMNVFQKNLLLIKTLVLKLIKIIYRKFKEDLTMNKERFGIVKELEFKNWHREWPIDIIRGVLTKDTLKNELYCS